MKSVVDSGREVKIELHTTTENGIFYPSCGCAKAGGGNFELHLAVLYPPNSRRDKRSQESHLGRIVVFKNRKLFFL
jgi:hypothetical protein